MEKEVIGSASHFIGKYYFNEKFIALPPKVRNEIRTMCILGAERVKAIFTIGIYENGEIFFETSSDDLNFDEINAKYTINKFQDENENMLKAISSWYLLYRGEK